MSVIRLIDADKVCELFDKVDTKGATVIERRILKEMQTIILLSVTVDTTSATEKVGTWVDKRSGAYGRMQSWCSACNKPSGIGGIESNRHKPYCPNCGARMDCGNKEAT